MRSAKAKRARLGSMGSPPVRRELRRRFWRLIAQGVQNPAAGAAVGVSQPTSWRWFTEAGGMAPLDLAEPSGRYLSFAERE